MRKVIQVKESGFKKKYKDWAKSHYETAKSNFNFSIWRRDDNQLRYAIVRNGLISDTATFTGNILKDGVKAINAALQEMFEDLSEEVKE